jgi:hypothetical protein
MDTKMNIPNEIYEYAQKYGIDWTSTGGGCMNSTNLDKIKELTEALKESIKWLECTEDGTDEQIRRIFGEETVDMLNRHRNIVKKTSEASVFPWEEKQEMQRKVIYETDPRLDPNFESSEGET